MKRTKSASTTAVSDLKNTSVSNNTTVADEECVPEAELVGGFGADDLEHGEERAALASVSKDPEAVGVRPHIVIVFLTSRSPSWWPSRLTRHSMTQASQSLFPAP